MIDIKQAVSIAKEKNKNMDLFYCLETNNWFKFSLALNKDELLGSGSVFAVNKKNGKNSWVNFALAPDDFAFDPIVKEYTQRELNKIDSL